MINILKNCNAWFFCGFLIFSVSLHAQQRWWTSAPGDSTYGANVDGVSRVVHDYGLKAKRTVIVGIIDGGMDVDHPLLQGHLWTNRKEKADGKDNDHNGLVDDIHGWNWLSGSNGTSVLRAGTAEYRQWKQLYLRKKTQGFLNSADSSLMDRMEQKVHMNRYLLYARNMQAIWGHVQVADSLMRLWGNGRELKVADFEQLDIRDTSGLMNALNTTALRVYTTEKSMKWDDFVEKHRREANLSAQRMASLQQDDDAHKRVGNDCSDFSSLVYGSSVLKVNDEDDYHATMVGGLVLQSAALAGAEAQLMVLRAVPDGDEYDRDIVAALRYAVDMGARVVNMSFGKTYSDYPQEVEAALDWAAKQDVLLVLSSGNNSKDLDQEQQFPDVMDAGGKRRCNILLVGAADEKGARADFSNYGVSRVDILAPGTNLSSYAPGGGWSVNQGTSLAAPIVAGVAASLRAYFPKLKAREIREIICQSARSEVHSGVRAGLLDAAEAFRYAALWQKR